VLGAKLLPKLVAPSFRFVIGRSRRRLYAATVALTALGGVFAFRPVAPVAPPMRVVAYLASWGVKSKGTPIAKLPANQLTHLYYAFALIDASGAVVLGDRCIDVGVCARGEELPAQPAGNFGELRKLKAKNPHLKLTISIGGWGGSARFSDAALTDESRKRFAESALDLFIRKWPGLFDGIDIDWEFPVQGGLKGNVERPEDKHNFTLLLAELRRELDEQGTIDRRHYELTIAASARPSEIANVELPQITQLLDFINVMTYDYHTDGPIAHFNAPLFAAKNDPTPDLNVDASMRAFEQGGVPAQKLLVGIPFFARAYGRVPKINAGLFQPSPGKPRDWHESDGDWRRLSRTRLNDPRYVRHWEPLAKVPWLYDALNGTWITYDDPQSVRAKVDYMREHNLGGVVIWEIGADDGQLIRAISGMR
jgi:chitinase